ncbi:MAG TPA: type 4a pilus biogenesis protein PilO [Rubrobacteraceae bacterium]|nr:type 4a pilus biogenesis protein PilO [Rubrobacteraceae bacterium]
MNRNDRNVAILGALIIVVLIVGYYFLLLSPLWTRYDDAVQERSDKEAQLQQLQQQVADLEKIKNDAPTVERQLLELSKRIPTQPEIPTLVVQVEEIADQAGVTQISIVPGSPGPAPGGGDFSVQPITMSFEGTYDQLQDFLLRTENLARLVTVKKVSYEPVEAEGTTAQAGTDPTLQVEIEADVYFQPENVPDGTAPVAPAAPQTTTPGAGGETTSAQ